MAQQGAAPDRLQLRSSFLLASLPAAGELVVGRRRAAWLCVKVKSGVRAFRKIARFFVLASAPRQEYSRRKVSQF